MGIPVGMGWVWGLKCHPHGSPDCVTFAPEYLGNRQRQRLDSKGPPIGNGIWSIK